MAVRKLKGSWWADFQIRLKRYRYRSPQNTREGALAYEALLRQKLAKGEEINPVSQKDDGLLFEAYTREWLETYVVPQNKPSECSTKKIVLRLHLVPWFGKMRLSDIGTVHIEGYKAAKLKQGLVEKTINNHLTILGKCLRSAEEWNILDRAPRIKPLRVPPQNFDFLTPLETHQLLSDDKEPVWNEMIRLAVRTGMRRGELAALDWSDVNLEKGSLTVRHSVVDGIVGSPKNNRIRQIPLTLDVRQMLMARGSKKGLVFHLGDGKHLDKSVSGGAIIRAARRANLRKIGWHVLRHTFASTMAAEGVPIPVIKELLGHASITMTMKYSHFASSSFQDAVAVLEAAEKREVAKKCLPAVNREKVLAGMFS